MASFTSLTDSPMTERDAVDEMFYDGYGVVVSSDDGERRLLISTTSEFRTLQFGLVVLNCEGGPVAAFSDERDALDFTARLADSTSRPQPTGSIDAVIADELRRTTERDSY